MRINKIVNGLLSVSLTCSLLATPVAAQINDTSVVNSGDNANVTSSTQQTSQVTVENTNNATINQTVDAVSNTGNNTVSKNISLGGTSRIETGAASTNTSLTVDVNRNTTAVTALNPSVANGTDVVNTGNNATVNTQTVNNSMIRAINENNATVNQTIVDRANTGGNEISQNMGCSSIQTGNAQTNSQINDSLNRNSTVVGTAPTTITPDPNITTLTNTGDRANIMSRLSNNYLIEVANTNNAYIGQSVMSQANSGRNTASKGIGSASVVVGAADTNNSLALNGNNNTVSVDNGAAQVSALNLHDIVNTGDRLTSDTAVLEEVRENVRNWNNLTSFQSFLYRSNTGSNQSTEGIGTSGILANRASTLLNLLDLGNVNWISLGGIPFN